MIRAWLQNLICVAMIWAAAAAAQMQKGEWLTRFEASGGLETPRYDETVDYCRRLDRASKQARLVSFGKSPEERDLPLLIISQDRAFTPEKALKSGKPVILIQGGIHSGESEGKDAVLILGRELLIDNKYPDLLDRLIILMVPIFNVDGHERFSPYNRINQNGPKEMGWRVTSTRLNLNRDFMKADSPEMRAWLAMYHRWLPHLFYDCHTTDGMDYQYQLTYNIDDHDLFGGEVSQWARESFLPSLHRFAKSSGMIIGPYADLIDEDHPEKGLMGGVWRPMLSNVYATVCNRAGFLIETHSLKPYAVRVQATHDFIVAGLQEIARNPRGLLQATAAEDARVSEWGRDDAGSPGVPLTFKTRTDLGDSLVFRGYRVVKKEGAISGENYPVYLPEIQDTPTLYFNRVDVAAAAVPPQGYIIPAGWQHIVEVLRSHAIPLRRLTRACYGKFQGYRLDEVKFRPASYEGRLLPGFRAVAIEEERAFPEGSYFAAMGTAQGKLLMNLLEPLAPDALVNWGMFNTIFEDREYFESYVMEPLAQRMATEDPGLAAAFDQKIAADPAFAGNPRARLRFFYEHSPWYDREKNIYPVWRVLHKKDLALSGE